MQHQSFTVLPMTSTKFRQTLKFGYGVPVTASGVKVYQAKTLRLIRVEDSHGNRIKGGTR